MYLELMAPHVLLILAGIISHRLLEVEAKPLAKLTLYVLSPALVFNFLVKSHLPSSELGKIAAGTVLLTLCLAAFVSVAGRLFSLSTATVSALQLGSVFMNVGNYGLPVILAVYGPEGVERTVIIMITHQILMFSLAVYLAGRSHMNVAQAFWNVWRMPSVYAAIIAWTCRSLGVIPPQPVMEPISLLAQSAIPVFLLLLGIQLSSIFLSSNWGLLSLGTTIKLALAPLTALVIGQALRLDPLSQKILILAAATPTAIVTTMLAIEFDAEPHFVSSLTLVTTVTSLVSFPLVIHFLR